MTDKQMNWTQDRHTLRGEETHSEVAQTATLVRLLLYFYVRGALQSTRSASLGGHLHVLLGGWGDSSLEEGRGLRGGSFGGMEELAGADGLASGQ